MTDISNIISTAENLLLGNSSISPSDFVTLFGGAQNITADTLTSYINGFANTISLPSIDSIADLSSTYSDTNSSTVVYTPNVITRNNVTGSNTSANGVINPTVRYVAPIGNEPPIGDNASQYPYNKVFVSESGHLQEIDDTPGHERILTQHISGTYDEMKASGDKVIKVVGDNYTIVAGADHITVQGPMHIHAEQELNIRVAGAVNIIADSGINFVTKGAFRVKAESIAMESTSGDISFSSAGNTLLTSSGDANISAKNIIAGAVQNISLTSNKGCVIHAQKYTVRSDSDIVSSAVGGIFLQSGSDTDIIAGGSNKVTASTVEVSGTLNVKSTTNMLAGGNPVNGQGAATASNQGVDAPAVAIESQGSGITGANNPSDTYMLNDDDDQAAMTAIQTGIRNGTIDPKNLIPPTATQSDTGPAGNISPSVKTSSIITLPNGPLDNLQLSPNFTLGMLSKHALVSPTPLTAQHGLSLVELAQNLQLLSLNCLESIKRKFPDMKVTSAFRIGTSSSQHELGKAADMQFASANLNKSQYFTIAQWIRDNIPFDQLILEYKNDGTKLPWIHVSFNAVSNRGQILTKFAAGGYGSGLHDLSG